MVFGATGQANAKKRERLTGPFIHYQLARVCTEFFLKISEYPKARQGAC